MSTASFSAWVCRADSEMQEEGRAAGMWHYGKSSPNGRPEDSTLGAPQTSSGSEKTRLGQTRPPARLPTLRHRQAARLGIGNSARNHSGVLANGDSAPTVCLNLAKCMTGPGAQVFPQNKRHRRWPRCAGCAAWSCPRAHGFQDTSCSCWGTSATPSRKLGGQTVAARTPLRSQRCWKGGR